MDRSLTSPGSSPMLTSIQSRRLRRASSCGLRLSKSGEHITEISLQQLDHTPVRSQHRIEVTDKINKVYFKHLIDQLASYRDLSEILITNAGMGSSIFKLLCSSLKSHKTAKLALLDVHGNQLDNECFENITNIGEQNLASITNINFSWNNLTTIPEPFCEAFERLTLKRDLTLILDYNPNLEFSYRIFTISCLRNVSLAGTGLSSSQINEMLPLIKSHPNLTSLDLSYNLINNEGILQIAHCIIEKNNIITRLCLLGNPFTQVASDALKVSLQLNRTITEFTPVIIFEEAQQLRTDYPGKDELTLWLQQLGLEQYRATFYKYRLTLEQLRTISLSSLPKNITVAEYGILERSIEILQFSQASSHFGTLFSSCKISQVAVERLDPNDPEGFSAQIHFGFWQGRFPVCLKVLKTDITSDPNGLYQLKSEANLLYKLKHPNVVKFFGIAENVNLVGRDSTIFIKCMVFERAQCDALQWIMSAECILHHCSPMEALKIRLKICLDICSAMLYLSNKSVVHRDLALRNILIFTNSGDPHDVVAKIADFGLSKYAKRLASSCRLDGSEESFSVSSYGSVSPRWTAPEGWNNNFSPKSDVWSFGVMVWELFQRQFSVPYSGVPNNSILIHIMRGNRLQQPELCPDNIWDIVKCCWMINPTERPTFRELSAQFRNVLQTFINTPEN